MIDDHPYMLDTNVFNSLLDAKYSITIFIQRRLIVTAIQHDELSKTPDPIRRAGLLHWFEVVDPEVKSPASFAMDVEGAGWDQAPWSTDNMALQMHERLRMLDKRSKDPINQWRDVLIGETAIKIGATLISGDRKLRLVVTEFGGQALDPGALRMAAADPGGSDVDRAPALRSAAVMRRHAGDACADDADGFSPAERQSG